MELAGARVGVLSENASLVVWLSLQAHAFEVVRATDALQLEDVDVALVDVAPDADATSLRDSVPEGPAVVLLVSDGQSAPDAGLVTRPYSMAELLAAVDAALRGARPTQPTDEVQLAPAAHPSTPAVAPTEQAPPPPAERRDELFVARPSRSSAETVVVPDPPPVQPTSREPTGVRSRRRRSRMVPLSPDGPPAPGGSVTQEGSGTARAPLATSAVAHASASSADPFADIEQIAARLTWLLAEAPFLAASQSFADGIATALAADVGASNAGLWREEGDSLVLLGQTGLSRTEQRITLHLRHPLLVRALPARGLLLENADLGEGLVLGVPGAQVTQYAVALVETAGVPVKLVTVGGESLAPDVIGHVERFMAETRSGWSAVTAVERLLRHLPH